MLSWHKDLNIEPIGSAPFPDTNGPTSSRHHMLPTVPNQALARYRCMGGARLLKGELPWIRIPKLIFPFHRGVFPKNRGTPKGMLYNGKPYLNGWFGGTSIFGNTQGVTWSKLGQNQGSARSGTIAVSAPWMLIPSPKKWPSTTRCPFLLGGEIG